MVDILTIQRLVLRHAGTGSRRGKDSHKERVNCGFIIGLYRRRSTEPDLPTTWATIHYSKSGAHSSG
ncbi:polymorphic toxin type 50 domain-containing protein [Actinotignum sanguinis]|uniref:Polymorphic toxin type 50 domain-containing protein n=2 Tax=Actinomycetaceae TaxID=2049 RepID=A0ABZ0RCN7_9ACTO|nr:MULTISPECIES: polymorphic toxin type 50 domain-containing protein [Actinotignum]WPJ89664.1 polymorphic toxin type 50 domain-containing protein [Schaalia turicensis]MDE1553245.1 polymorphic toxin type 50 domain-containing protein [Actinotignum sanguinis]MDE1566109.1 polymorphic toxin type 50 domain-containing protein [Actinotignum sanguinis]MDE1577124.1 polymorphic toxin type 50 domain-containing protein [Actinotignum sanguinis]MDE1642945.1 polymorphic toxin type 50 domain-containing protein